MTEPGPRPPSPANNRPAPWSLVIGVAALAVIAGALVVMLLDRDDGGTASASSTTTATVGALPTAPETPEAASASPSSEPIDPNALPEGLLPPGSVITIIAESVRIRSAPSTTAEIVAVMNAGDPAYVIDSIGAGPVVADGYDWYQIEYAGGREIWPWQDVSSTEAYGWMAAGSGDQRFVELAEVECPSQPPTLQMLAQEVTPWERLVCYGGEPITLEGTFGCDGCLDTTPGARPTWLADGEQQPPISGVYQYYPYVQIAVPPDLTPPQNRDIVRAVLHLDDLAAPSCTYAPPAEGSNQPPALDPITAQLFCRERLVLDSFEVTGRDDSPS